MRPLTAARVLRRLERLPNDLEKAGYALGLKRPDPELVPDFLVIGFRKTGSTWLHENLHAHPEIYVGDQKGVRYFDRQFHDRIETYFEHFRDGRQRVKGDVSPGYVTLSEPRVRFIRRLMPRVKLVLLVRNPVEQEWARVVHDLRKSDRELEAVPDAEILKHLERSKVLRTGGFVRLITRWQHIFSPEQLFIGLYDDVKHHPQRLLTDVFQHIGVTTDVDWDAFPYSKVIIPPCFPHLRGRNDGRGTAMPGYRPSTMWFPNRYRRILRHRYADDLRLLHAMLGDRVAHWDRPPSVGSDPDQRVLPEVVRSKRFSFARGRVRRRRSVPTQHKRE